MKESLKESIESFRNKLRIVEATLYEADQQQEDEQDPNAQQHQQEEDPNADKGYEPTEQQTPANAQAKVDDEAENPGTLQLADGTDTDIQKDSNDVEDSRPDEVPPPEGETEIKFENGNFDGLDQSSQKYAELVQNVEQTFVPLCEKALIELLGNNQAYRRVEFNAVPNMNGQNSFKIDVDLKYHVDLMIGTDVDPQAVQHDTAYILSTIKPTPGMQVRQCKIDTQTGDVIIGVTIVQ